MKRNLEKVNIWLAKKLRSRLSIDSSGILVEAA